MKDPMYAAKLEAALKAKFGADILIHPKTTWTPEKEELYLRDLAEITKAEFAKESEFVEDGDVVISKKILAKKAEKTCNICNSFSLNRMDNAYLIKHGTCCKCFILHKEGRNEDSQIFIDATKEP